MSAAAAAPGPFHLAVRLLEDELVATTRPGTDDLLAPCIGEHEGLLAHAARLLLEDDVGRAMNALNAAIHEAGQPLANAQRIVGAVQREHLHLVAQVARVLVLHALNTDPTTEG